MFRFDIFSAKKAKSNLIIIPTVVRLSTASSIAATATSASSYLCKEMTPLFSRLFLAVRTSIYSPEFLVDASFDIFEEKAFTFAVSVYKVPSHTSSVLNSHNHCTRISTFLWQSIFLLLSLTSHDACGFHFPSSRHSILNDLRFSFLSFFFGLPRFLCLTACSFRHD